MALNIEHFFDPTTATLSYLVWDSNTLQCAVIDSVLDYDPKSGRTSTTSAQRIVKKIQALGLHLQWIMETHAHADHLSASVFLKQTLGGQVVIGAEITQVQQTFSRLFNAESSFKIDGSQFDVLLQENKPFYIGSLAVYTMATPGHTPACITYVVSDGHKQAAFIGDTLFAPDYGTARCDFPAGDAATLYQSIQKILSLPDDTLLYLCHDYQPSQRSVIYVTTVAEQRAHNIHIHTGISQADFVHMRNTRDATLDAPVLLLPSVQVNMRAGHLPPAEDNGVHYLKIPINQL